jgi:hypothetical protein
MNTHATQDLTSQLVVTDEPMGREQTIARLRELETWGVDLSLVRDNLSRTPAQRLTQMYGILTIVEALQQGTAARAVDAAMGKQPGQRT